MDSRQSGACSMSPLPVDEPFILTMIVSFHM